LAADCYDARMSGPICGIRRAWDEAGRAYCLTYSCCRRSALLTGETVPRPFKGGGWKSATKGSDDRVHPPRLKAWGTPTPVRCGSFAWLGGKRRGRLADAWGTRKPRIFCKHLGLAAHFHR
jgi:hypothetical protein